MLLKFTRCKRQLVWIFNSYCVSQTVSTILTAHNCIFSHLTWLLPVQLSYPHLAIDKCLLLLLRSEHIVHATAAAQTKKCTRLATGGGHQASLTITLEARAAEALLLAASCSRGTDLQVYNGAAWLFTARCDHRKHTSQRSVGQSVSCHIPSRN